MVVEGIGVGAFTDKNEKEGNLISPIGGPSSFYVGKIQEIIAF